MDKSQKQSQVLDWDIIKRILRLANPYKLLFYCCIILGVVLAPVSILRPYIVNLAVDNHIMEFNMSGLQKMILLFMGVLLLEVCIRYVFIYCTNLLGQSIIKDLRVKTFNHISSLKLGYFDKTPIGTATTRTINDIEAINQVFSQGVITMVADILGIVAVLVIMTISSVKLTAICLIMMPVMIFGTYIFKEKVKVSYQTVRNQISKMNAFMQERITGMRIVQLFNAQKQELSKFKKINREYTQANLNAILYYAVFFPFVELVSAIALALMVWWATRGVIDQTVTIGTLIAFPMYLRRLFFPMRQIADRFNTLQMGMVAGDRVFKLLDRTDLINNDGEIQEEKLAGSIEFDGVWFAYDNINYVLKEVDFSLNAGETMAIVGSTGSGKTSIINLLSRFYEYQKGEIRIDNRDIRAYDLDSLRARIATVLQDVFLFTGTVLENITLRNPNITEEMVRAAATMIGADKFIEELPDGYHFEVLERGANLSMGQAQLISFVRTLVYDPDILILDEATSSIDSETEAVIQHAIETLIKKRTSVIIAHRLSTVRHADKILVMEKGEVKEIGNHEELVNKKDGLYRKLYDMQFKEEALTDF